MTDAVGEHEVRGGAQVEPPRLGVPAQPTGSTEGGLGEDTDRLRAAVRALRQPESRKRAPAPTSSVYKRAVAAAPDGVRTGQTREALRGRFRTVETAALMAGTELLLVVLPDEGSPPRDVMDTARTVVAGGGQTVLLGPSTPRQVKHAPLTVPLRHDDLLASEWAIVACSPIRRVAFLAQCVGPDAWDSLLTRDPVAVHRAASAILDRVPFLRLRVPPLSS